MPTIAEQIAEIARSAPDGLRIDWGMVHDGRKVDAERPSLDLLHLVVVSVSADGKANGQSAAVGRLGGIALKTHENLLILTADGGGKLITAKFKGEQLHGQAVELGISTAAGKLRADQDSDVSATVDRVLNALLLGERPCRWAELHCMVTMQFNQPDNSTEQDLVRYRALRCELIDLAASGPMRIESDQKGAHYFLPHTYQVLVSGAVDPGGDDEQLDESVISLNLPCDTDECLVVSRDKWSEPVAAQLSALRLHLYTERTIALEYALRLTGMHHASANWGDTLWGDIIACGPNGWQHSTAAWLDYAEAARTLYSGFKADAVVERARQFETWLSGAKDATRLAIWSQTSAATAGMRLPIQGTLRNLLARFVGEERASAAYFALRVDDRARVVQSLTPSGEWPVEGRAAEQLPVLAARFALVDEFGTEHFYARDFAEPETDETAYDRFCGPDQYHGGSRFFANDHAFGHLGFGWYSAKVIGQDHMRGIYRRMALLLHLNGGALFGLLRDLGDALKGWDTGLNDDDRVTEQLGGLHRRYLKFLNLNWFEQVSSQVQGIELFDLLRRASPAARELRLVGEQVGCTSDYLTQHREVRREALGRFLATLLAIVTLLAGLPALLTGSSVPALRLGIDAMLGAGFTARWTFEIAGAAMIVLLALFDWLGLLGTPARRNKPKLNPAMVAALGAAIALPLLAPPLASIGTALVSSYGVPLTAFPWLYPPFAAVAAAGGFYRVWSNMPGQSWSDRLTRKLGPIYAGLIASYVLLASAHTTGLVTVP